ncbi:MAG: hypothetical protein ACREJR_01780 [Candidatus Rokuibacteriota bacterium]
MLDSGPALLRLLLGFRPAGEATAEILGDGAAGVSRALASVVPLHETLLAARLPTGPVPTSFTDAVAAWIVNAVRGPDSAIPNEAAVAVARLGEIPRAVARARLRLFLLVLGGGGLRWLEGLGVGLAVRAGLGRVGPPRRSPAPRPLDRPEIDAARVRRWRRARAPAEPIEALLVRDGVPMSLASEIAGRFAEAPDWPGSLRGHDRKPGGLRRHTLRVLETMREETATWPGDTRAAAAVVAAAHDLGKHVTYRRVAPDRWVGVAATPHDALSAILLAQCPAWPAFASAETRAAVLQCLHAEHAPEGLSANAPPLARDLLAALKRADAAAAREVAPAPDGGARGPADAA